MEKSVLWFSMILMCGSSCLVGCGHVCQPLVVGSRGWVAPVSVVSAHTSVVPETATNFYLLRLSICHGCCQTQHGCGGQEPANKGALATVQARCKLRVYLGTTGTCSTH